MNQTNGVLRRVYTVLILSLLATVTLFTQEPDVGFVPPEDVALI